jgi:anti-sigma B factor antagonist
MRLPPETPRSAAGALVLAVRRTESGHAVLEVAGEIDMVTAPQLANALAELLDQDERVVVVDLSEVRFLGSSGLAVLVNCYVALEPGTALLIVASRREVRRAFAVTGLDGRLPLYPTREAAFASL